MGGVLRILALFLAIGLNSGALAQCRQALALGLDVSGSVDATEYHLQMRGLANALRHPDVSAALLAAPNTPVYLAVFEWSGADYQRIVLGWTPILDAETLRSVAARLESSKRGPAPPVTALGRAMLFGKTLLDQRPECWKRTLDISGDGKSNAGPRPQDVQGALDTTAMTLNALVIGSDEMRGNDRREVQIAELSAYFGARVIHGPDAFVETAQGFRDYEAAMVRKLKREIDGLAVSSLSSPGQTR
ncbi:DUF1194 domain-containing protein [Arenibacterium sp. CAU 1754]